MEKNFQIGQSNEILVEDNKVDVRNSYDLSKIVLAPLHVDIAFEPNLKDGKGLRAFSLRFTEVVSCLVGPNFYCEPNHDLDEMGYKESFDFDDEWLLTEDQATPEDHLFFRFHGGRYIRIYAKYAKFQFS